MLDAASLTPLPPQRQAAAAVSSEQSAGSIGIDEDPGYDADCDVQQKMQPTKLFEETGPAAAPKQVIVLLSQAASKC